MLINGFVKHDGFLRRGRKLHFKDTKLEGINRPMFFITIYPKVLRRGFEKFNFHCWLEKGPILFSSFSSPPPPLPPWPEAESSPRFCPGFVIVVLGFRAKII